MKALSLKIPPALDRELAESARRQGASKSTLIREALARYLASGARPAKGSFLAAAGHLAGCVEGPPDLSLAGEHLDGYGQ